jgi:pilus assembly protein CpaF
MLTGAQVQELVERMLKSSGRRIDISRPFVDAMLPQGHRLHVVLEGISRGWSAVNLRTFVLTAARLHELVELGTLSLPAAAFLEASVRAGLNILVAGATQAGKTTLEVSQGSMHTRARDRACTPALTTLSPPGNRLRRLQTEIESPGR